MKTLIINGSPRPNGDTASLIRCLEKGLTGAYRVLDAYRRQLYGVMLQLLSPPDVGTVITPGPSGQSI